MYTPDTTIMSSPFKSEICREEEVCRGMFLDTLPQIRKLRKIDVLKIDVEGAEYDALYTARNTLKKTKYLFIETSIQRPSSGSLFDILRLVRNFCPKAEILHVGKPFIVSGKPMCVDLLISL